MSDAREAIAELDCFGSRCAALVIGPGQAGSAHDAAALAKRTLLAWHERFSRFNADSELSRLNRDPRETVPVSPLLAHLAQAVRDAGVASGGLVDGTLVPELERAGYVGDLREPLALRAALALAPARKPAAASPAQRWRELDVDLDACTITRPPGLMLDSGGLAKGLFADVLGAELATHAGFAVNCAGDLRIGGAAQITRAINVESPFDASTLHTFERSHSGVATSGIGRRSWLMRDGHPAHHLLDPSSGEPAYTGIVQVTALAPSALAAEIAAKAALLSGPRTACTWLAHGGVIVYDDGSHELIAPAPTVTLAQLYATSSRSPTRPNAPLSCSVSSAAGSGRAIT
jgi:thiamine biosynthesis lipoprotein